MHSPPPGFHGTFRTDVDARGAYSESAGILRAMPLAVAVPDTPTDVQALARWASRERVPLIARGSGSSMSGAAVGPGVIVDTHRLRAIDAVDPAWNRLRVGAAVTRSRADDAARHHGLRVPVDPSSGAFATIGGMAATNAAGPRTMRFGAMRRWVHAIDCVFADGSAARVSRDRPPVGGATLARWAAAAPDLRARCARLEARHVRKDSSGYGVHDFAVSGDLIDLLVGSEGTLALFTAVELDVLPLPVASASLLCSWPDLDLAVRGAALAREAGAVACELLDASFLAVAARARALPVPSSSEAVLIIEFEDAEPGFATSRAEALAAACRQAGASTTLLGLDPESEEALWALRHAASPILSRLDPHIRSMQVVEDGCVPPERLADYVRGVRAALQACALEGVLFGHAGDAHVHVNALVDVRSPTWKVSVRALYDRVAELTARLGGTMAGEHGDGRLRSPLMSQFWSADAMAIFAELKALFDPVGILNPGVKVGATTDPFQRVKYDPSDAIESPPAHRVLEEVEATRAYDTLRLELLDRSG
ncbi:MAG: FAD-binding oxidoreductase [Gemmatimonadaceae bacterium]|nr:FAD-binding oxidoreductase [Gemmatimonadaceae bacterium]